MRKARGERGQILAVVALALVALLGVAAFSIDVGYAYYAKRQLQSATDAAALAGAQDLPNATTAIATATTIPRDFDRPAGSGVGTGVGGAAGAETGVGVATAPPGGGSVVVCETTRVSALVKSVGGFTGATPVTAPANAAANARHDEKRSPGRRASARITTASTGALTCGAAWRSGTGGSTVRLRITSSAVRPSCGSRPESAL